ncbi:MAG TPA: hypothetical protein PLK90_01065 [Clostridiales bacterium]|jgi:hypothetical protein|nr:hypothetical protein [Clostridiales bacterium]HQP68967.1 hypothetical protein [Clostridiales bacterium]
MDVESENTGLKERKYLFLMIACVVSTVNWIDVVYFTDYNSKSFTIGLPYFYHLTLIFILIAVIRKERPWLLYLFPLIMINFSYGAMEMFMGIAIIAVLSLPIYSFVHFSEIKTLKREN